MTTLKNILTYTLYMIFRKSRMGSHCISCRDFFKFDHLVIGSYSYFIYDDLGEQDDHLEIHSYLYSVYDI
jgi:hypothetical protein